MTMLSKSRPWAPGRNEDAASGRVKNCTQGTRVAQASVPEKRENRGRYRQRALKRPNTSSTSPKQIEMAKRRAEALELRLQGYTYEAIADHLGSSKSVIAKDITRAMADLVTEPAERVFRMEMHRLDALAAAHYADACNGDIPAGQMMLRIIEMRGRMLGFFDRERMAGRFTLTQDTPEGPRALSLEFVLPSGARHGTLEDMDSRVVHHDSRASPLSSPLSTTRRPVSPPFIDATTLPPHSGVPLVRPKKGFNWE